MAARGPGQPPDQERIERLLFEATNPCSDREDVNLIKQFCDAVCQAPDSGPLVATRLLAHKIQSPQPQEALLALAVLEAAVKACGDHFQAEVGKFRFLNELVKLVSPKYAGTRTPDHVKTKVIELLYVWTKEIPHEKKIAEAYEMLKAQGLVESDPDYVIGAVFPTSVTPRTSKCDLDDAESKRLQKLLRSSNPEDIQAANQLIKGMVKKDEEKMEKISKRVTLLESVNTNVKLLTDLLDNYDGSSSSSDERELITELGQACEKVRPSLYRVASEVEDGDETIGEVLVLSEDLTKVIDRYRSVILLQQPDPRPRVPAPPPAHTATADTLLNLDPPTTITSPDTDKAEDTMVEGLENLLVRKDLLDGDQQSSGDNNEDLMSQEPGNAELLSSHGVQQSPVKLAPPLMMVDLSSSQPAPAPAPTPSTSVARNVSASVVKTVGPSLDPLDLLGESLMKQNLPSNMEPSFDQKRSEKLPLNELMRSKTVSEDAASSSPGVIDLTSQLPVACDTSQDVHLLDSEPKAFTPTPELITVSNESSHEEQTKVDPKDEPASSPKYNHITNLSTINVEMSELEPDPSVAPLTLQSSQVKLVCYSCLVSATLSNTSCSPGWR